MLIVRLIVAHLVILLAADFSHAVTISTVPIGNPGNARDTQIMDDGTSGYGSVPYSFRMAKFEVTAGQYAEFLNAVAKDDLYGLYNPSMSDPEGMGGANIHRIGSAGSYGYSVEPDWANRPVIHVSFWDAARFANWLHNGQPSGPQNGGTTENGAYNLDGYTGVDGSSIIRNPGAKFWIPSENEWYKVAYHDQSTGLAASYFDFPTGSDSVPGIDISETTNIGNNANYYRNINTNGYVIGPPYYRTVVGEFELSDSPYGTFDQSGNVLEWNETLVFTFLRGLRGGSYGELANAMNASARQSVFPSFEISAIGFRIAAIIPEPSTLLLGALAFLFILRHSRRVTSL